MRTLFVGALAASLAGCSCYVPPQAVDDACIGAGGYACFDRSSVNQALEPELASLSTSKPKSKVATTEKPSFAHARQRMALVIDTAKSTTATTVKPAAATVRTAATKVEPAATKGEPAASKVEAPPSDRPAETSDQVIAKATAAIASKLEDPKSAQFGEMKRAMRTNMLGKSVDTVCGHVKARKASGEGMEDRTFLYLVKDDEAYVADGPALSTEATAYRNVCN
jgi:hypothetical protein